MVTYANLQTRKTFISCYTDFDSLGLKLIYKKPCEDDLSLARSVGDGSAKYSPIIF